MNENINPQTELFVLVSIKNSQSSLTVFRFRNRRIFQVFLIDFIKFLVKLMLFLDQDKHPVSHATVLPLLPSVFGKLFAR